MKQKQLDLLYLEYLENILSDELIKNMILNYDLSSPLFLDINVKNGKVNEKDYTLLYVGQQTKGWLNPNEVKGLNISNKKDYLTALKQLYYDFNFGDRLQGKKYNGYLWQFQHHLLTSINELTKNRFGLLWTNILRVDQNGEKIKTNEIIEKIAYSNNKILREEIKKIAPDAVVFVTGYNFDSLLSTTFDDIVFSPSKNKNLDLRKLAVLESSFLPKLSFRTYHPRPLYQNKYLRNSRDEIIKTISSTIFAEIGKG